MSRRKRIPFDPPGSHKKKRRRPVLVRADQLFLTRRLFVAKTAVVGAFVALAGKLGYMQVVQHQQYQTEAKNNTQEFQPIKAPRGLIYDRKGRELAINVRSWQVQVVPGDLPDDDAQKQRVLDTLTTLLGLRDALVLDPNNIPEGQEDTVYRRTAQMLGYDQQWIDQIKAAATINYLVLLQDELTDDEAARFRAAASELPGVQVMNILDYQIQNTSAPLQPIVIQKNVPRDTALKLEANKLYLPGVELDDSALLRQYVGGDVMSHLLGYVGTINESEYDAKENRNAAGQHIYERDDIIGKNGLELSMEPVLRGQKGGQWVEIDAQGYVVRQLSQGYAAPVPGKNIKLTVDLELQAAISDFLQRGIKFSNDDRRAKGTLANDPDGGSGRGAVVMLDVRTGEVLAMVSWPQYDNELFVEGISQRKFDQYRNDKNEPLTNHACGGHYPPGSTIKPFMASSALHEKTLTTDQQHFCSGGLIVPYDNDESKGQVFWCWARELGGHGSLDILGGLEQSCDVFFYNVGAPRQKSGNDYLHYYDMNSDTGQMEPDAKHYFQGLGIDLIHRDLTENFWLGQPTKIDLPWEAPGLVPDEKWLWENYQQPWSAGATINASIGQGYFLATPLQMALNVAAIANNGTVYRPLLINEIVDDQKKASQKAEPDVLRKVGIEAGYLKVVQEGMRLVVSQPEGTANHSTINDQPVSKWLLTNPAGEPEIPIAGKTGTAEFGIQDPKTGAYVQSHAWFTCYASYDQPEVAVAVFLYDGGEGSTYAVPVADQTLRAYFELTGKRKRGVVLRKDGKPIGKDTPSPLAQNTTPAPGTIKSQGDH